MKSPEQTKQRGCLFETPSFADNLLSVTYFTSLKPSLAAYVVCRSS